MFFFKACVLCFNLCFPPTLLISVFGKILASDFFELEVAYGESRPGPPPPGLVIWEGGGSVRLLLSPPLDTGGATPFEELGEYIVRLPYTITITITITNTITITITNTIAVTTVTIRCCYRC